MGSQDGVVGPRRNLAEAWSAELMLIVPETWDVLLVLRSDLTVGVERCTWPSTETHHVTSPVAWWASLLASLPCQTLG